MFKQLPFKAILLIISIISVLTVSCKKEHNIKTQTGPKTYTVRFRVEGFSQNSGPFKTNSIHTNSVTADSLKKSIDVLYYLVYKNTSRYRKITQYSTDPNFGTITDSFDAGNVNMPNKYKVVVVAGKTNFVDSYKGIEALSDFDQFQYIDNGVVKFFNDAFYKSVEFTTPDSTYNLSLDRAVAQLQVKINDAIPANAKNIILTFNDYQSIYATKGLPRFDDVQQRTVTVSATPGAINTVLSAILLNTLSPFDVEIKCVDAADNVIAVNTVTGVTCKMNEVTILTGNLFGQPGSNFYVTYNPAWGTPVYREF
jgi:hypothetical protein